MKLPIRPKGNYCTDCDLHIEAKSNCIPARRLSERKPLKTSKGIKVLLVGEAPGYHEDLQGLPFVGAAGEILDTILEVLEVDPSEIAITNLVRCRPPQNRKPYMKEQRECWKYLEMEISILQPVLIVALGATSWRSLGDGSNLTRSRLRQVKSPFGFPVVPTFHPAAALYEPSKMMELAEDLESIFKTSTKTQTIRWCKTSFGPGEQKAFERAKEITLDIETKGLRMGAKLLMVGYLIKGRHRVAVSSTTKFFLGRLRRKLEDREVLFRGHNIKFDLGRLAFHLKPKALLCRAEDTMVLDFMLHEDSTSRSLERLSRLHTPLKAFKHETEALWAAGEEVPLDTLAERNAYDVAATAMIAERLKKLLRADGAYSESLLHLYERLIPFVAHLESVGIAVDPEERDRQKISTERKIKRLTRELRRTAPDTLPTSPQQIRKLLFRKWALPPQEMTPKGSPSTSKLVLEKLIELIPPGALQRRYLESLLDLRAATKQLGTFIEQIPKDSTLLYPEYFLVKGESHGGGLQGGTVTGRISVKKPAIQTFQKGSLRKMFVSRYRNGRLFILDGAQMELRVAAAMSQDPTLLRAFEKGQDLHQRTATFCGIKRGLAKNINFASIYKSTVGGLIEKFSLSREMATKIHHFLASDWARLYAWEEEVIERALEEKRVSTPYGAIRRLPKIARGTPEGQEAIRQAVNFLIQRTASDLVQLLGALFLQESDRDKFLPVMTHHDGLIFDVRGGGERTIRRVLKRWRQECLNIMGYCPDIPFDFDLTVGKNWAEQEKVCVIRA